MNMEGIHADLSKIKRMDVDRMNADQREIIGTYLANLDIGLSVSAYHLCNADWRHPNVLSDFNRLYFFLESGARIWVNNRELLPKAGQMVVLPAGAKLSLEVLDGAECGKHYCHFTASVGDINLFRLLDTELCADVPDVEGMIGRFKEMTAHFKSREWTSQLRAKTVLADILCTFIELCGVREVRLSSSSNIEKANVVLHFIDEHLAEEMSLEDLARLVHFHPNYFIPFFKSIVGRTPMQYIQHKRLQAAKRLLGTTDLSVSEVAARVGSTLFPFSKAFKQQTGFSPTEFRKNTRLAEGKPAAIAEKERVGD